MTMSIEELQSSLEKVSDFDVSFLDQLMADLRTWLSASITYQETCLDGFENSTSDAGQKMKKALKTAMEMSSSGLDIIDGFANVIYHISTYHTATVGTFHILDYYYYCYHIFSTC